MLLSCYINLVKFEKIWLFKIPKFLEWLIIWNGGSIWCAHRDNGWHLQSSLEAVVWSRLRCSHTCTPTYYNTHDWLHLEIKWFRWRVLASWLQFCLNNQPTIRFTTSRLWRSLWSGYYWAKAGSPLDPAIGCLACGQGFRPDGCVDPGALLLPSMLDASHPNLQSLVVQLTRQCCSLLLLSSPC